MLMDSDFDALDMRSRFLCAYLELVRLPFLGRGKSSLAKTTLWN